MPNGSIPPETIGQQTISLKALIWPLRLSTLCTRSQSVVTSFPHCEVEKLARTSVEPLTTLEVNGERLWLQICENLRPFVATPRKSLLFHFQPSATVEEF